jgi:hypothetical protein
MHGRKKPQKEKLLEFNSIDLCDMPYLKKIKVLHHARSTRTVT